MQAVTLISDMGLRDYFAGMMKGALLTHIPNGQLVDITHAIPPGNISLGAFALKNSYKLFPPGTIHIVAVDTNLYGNIRHVAFEAGGHYFVGTDNGIFSMALEQYPTEVYDITAFDQPESYSFPGAYLFPKIAGLLAEGMKPSEVGRLSFGLLEKTQLNAVVEPHVIRGAVIYIDSVGNAITNIDRELFERVAGGRKFIIFLRRAEYQVKKISRFYCDVPDGNIAAIFNASGNLELAMNTGNISKMVGLNLGDIIRIEFTS